MAKRKTRKRTTSRESSRSRASTPAAPVSPARSEWSSSTGTVTPGVVQESATVLTVRVETPDSMAASVVDNLALGVAHLRDSAIDLKLPKEAPVAPSEPEAGPLPEKRATRVNWLLLVVALQLAAARTIWTALRLTPARYACLVVMTLPLQIVGWVIWAWCCGWLLAAHLLICGIRRTLEDADETVGELTGRSASARAAAVVEAARPEAVAVADAARDVAAREFENRAATADRLAAAFERFRTKMTVRERFRTLVGAFQAAAGVALGLVTVGAAWVLDKRPWTLSGQRKLAQAVSKTALIGALAAAELRGDVLLVLRRARPELVALGRRVRSGEPAASSVTMSVYCGGDAPAEPFINRVLS